MSRTIAAVAVLAVAAIAVFAAFAVLNDDDSGIKVGDYIEYTETDLSTGEKEVVRYEVTQIQDNGDILYRDSSDSMFHNVTEEGFLALIHTSETDLDSYERSITSLETFRGDVECNLYELSYGGLVYRIYIGAVDGFLYLESFSGLGLSYMKELTGTSLR